MRGLFIPGITAEMFKNGCLESIEVLMAEGEVYDIDYLPWIPVSKRLPNLDDYTSPEEINTNNTSMFVKIENGDTYIIAYHKQTKVMYAISDGSYNYGTFTVMLDADGKPMLYNGE